MERIGLIAGNRKFPIVFSQEAKKQGCFIVAVAIKKDTSACLKKYVDKIYWLGLNEFSRMFDVFRQEGISKLVMAGQISPRRLFSKETYQDPRLRELLTNIKDQRADTIFGAIADELKKEGFELLDSTIFINNLLPAKGVLTDKELSPAQKDDVSFGVELARQVGRLDIGQTVAVKNKAIVAVEALEGTDNLIRRAGRLASAGVTIIKMSKPNQDMRFDVPVIGYNTIKNLIRAKVSCLAIEAGKTLFIDKEKSIALANKKSISIVAVE